MQEDLFRKQKKKEFLTVLLISMFCISAAIWSAAAFSRKKTGTPKEETTTERVAEFNETKELAQIEPETTIAPPASLEVEVQPSQKTDNETDKKSTTSPASHSSTNAKDSETNHQITSEAETTAPPTPVSASAPASSLQFSESSMLQWPVTGSVILEYNMTNTIYFPTLDSYRCNPAMVIQSDIGTPVHSAAKGYVKEVGTNEEIGNYVVMQLGNDYELTYGQLGDVSVKEGDYVDSGTKIACIAEPSSYYQREGINLYLKLTHQDAPLDPLDFLK